MTDIITPKDMDVVFVAPYLAVWVPAIKTTAMSYASEAEPNRPCGRGVPNKATPRPNSLAANSFLYAAR